MSNFDLLWHYLPVSLLDSQVWQAECTIKIMRETGFDCLCIHLYRSSKYVKYDYTVRNNKSFTITYGVDHEIF